MNIKTFIDRPVLSTVISIVIVIGGFIGLASLAIERYPNIAPPTVMVNTTYTGASAETVQKSVIIPLEEAINGVENMTYMYSTATNNGSASIQVFFKQGSDPNIAAVNVQNAVARANRQLPSEINDVGITVRKRQNNFLYQVALYSPRGSYNREFLSNYLKINILPQISRIPGVGDVDVRGADYGMRIWLKPDVMAQYKLVPNDIATVLGEQNIEAATGAFGENSDRTFQYSMRYKGRLEKPEEFENIVLRALPNGEVLRLKDVAEVELGAQTYLYNGEMNHCPSSSISIYQSPGSNATEVINAVSDFLEGAKKDFPIDMDIAVLYDANNFLYASIENVVRTLIEAIILVTLVVLIFLGSGRSTLIPIIATLVSIIGTFMFLYIFGFSINLLTLFALVLSIGVVVDDSIIVVEAIHTKLDSGYTDQKVAAVDAMHDVTAALITSTLVFMAVFIPVSMMGGTSGVFYTQFGITMAVSVGISAINALTLSPALCAILLKPKDAEGTARRSLGRRFFDAFETGFEAVRRKYLGGIRFFLKHRWLSPILVVIAIAGLVYNMYITKTGLVPQEDMGTVRVEVIAPPGSSMAYTQTVMDRIERDVIADLDEVANYEKMTGFGQISGAGASHGSFTLRMKNWADRPGKEHTAEAVVTRLKAYAADMKDATMMINTPAMIPGYGSASGLEMYVQDRKGGTVEDLYAVTQDFMAAMKARPEVGSINTSFKPNFPTYELDVDAIKCKRVGVSPKDVLSVIHGYYGGLLSTKFNRFTKIYQVVVQADPKYREDKDTFKNIFIRVGDDMAPVSQFVTMKKVYAPETLNRFNMFPSIRVNGRPEEGYSSGDVLKAVYEVAEETIPQGYGFDFGGMTREEASTGNNTTIIFIICFVLIYLILCALYESYILPLAVLVSVPFGLWGSFLLARAFGAENNIYLQTGLIMLIGLLSKTAILITEYAITKRREGLGLAVSALGACKERFRPIMMTVLTMIFGLLPLLFATGAGANGNHTLGAGVIGGMTLGTLAMLFVVPAMFIVFQGFQEIVSGKRKEGKK